MAEAKPNRDDGPYQLWASLQCRTLRDRRIISPFIAAIEAAKYLDKQREAGVIPLSEFMTV